MGETTGVIRLLSFSVLVFSIFFGGKAIDLVNKVCRANLRWEGRRFRLGRAGQRVEFGVHKLPADKSSDEVAGFPLLEDALVEDTKVGGVVFSACPASARTHDVHISVVPGGFYSNTTVEALGLQIGQGGGEVSVNTRIIGPFHIGRTSISIK